MQSTIFRMTTERSEDPAPFLSLLHQAMEQPGPMSKETLDAMASTLKMPLSILHQAASFYHYSNLGKETILRQGARGSLLQVFRLPASILRGAT